MIPLYGYQREAMKRMRNGCILCGGVGSGKSRTALAYYFTRCQGCCEPYSPMTAPKPLYIITTARKRDTLEWEAELTPFLMEDAVIDSWNNIGKYKEIRDAFFVLDEQRVVGSGAWVKSFLKIAKANEWILLSATPGDTWQDYIPVMIANGYYKNRTEFGREHIVYSRFSKFPKVERYLNTGRLIRERNEILVNMDFQRETAAHHEDIWVSYDLAKYREAGRTRFDPYKQEPIANAGGLCYVWRRIVNEDGSRAKAVLEICEKHERVIVFYNFDYELALLKGLGYLDGTVTAEWNGHAHEPLPKGERWVYLVQYTAGCEGWNCVSTDTMIFFSQNYSYKVMAQAAGRTDRLNTPYSDLWYYHLKSKSGIDMAIEKALKGKRSFTESGFVQW